MADKAIQIHAQKEVKITNHPKKHNTFSKLQPATRRYLTPGTKIHRSVGSGIKLASSPKNKGLKKKLTGSRNANEDMNKETKTET